MPIGSGMDVLTAKISSNENRAVTYQIPMLQDHRSTQGCIPIVDDGNVLLAMAWTTPGHGGSQKRILGDNQEPARMRICRSGPTIQREWAGKGLESANCGLDKGHLPIDPDIGPYRRSMEGGNVSSRSASSRLASVSIGEVNY
ncbi:hypothetical protein BO79DRAFT_221196 [Aspergillus costaricaensis CBS 115574]|uniref:Uncharacterized protein n=1 Tax=Aspergillus costaricaensis CBS 115574 TaxID=1448317 RepID=A0ACD1I5J7_9EURO|nr:hypothetical protein BO79DRAFT_221196 [Aspergillus costaricaensis CBS 115574]RAK85029.1 hypothetical protein BO79DRAFT_221196 [Aspergillus costaricaensis CBS 115574]